MFVERQFQSGQCSFYQVTLRVADNNEVNGISSVESC